MTFDQTWEAARYNIDFWIIHICGVLGIICLIVIALRVGNKKKRRIAYFITMFVMLIIITGETVSSIDSKWEIRRQAAKTEEQNKAVVYGDTANLVFSPVIGGFRSFAYIGMGTIAILIARQIKKHNNK